MATKYELLQQQISEDTKFVRDNMITIDRAKLLISEAMTEHNKEKHKAVSWTLIGQLLAAGVMIISALKVNGLL